MESNVGDDGAAAPNQPLYPTCDLCHRRKVRCDKKDPCGNCIDGRVACSRSRSKKTSQRQRVSSRKRLNNNLNRRQEVVPQLEPTAGPSPADIVFHNVAQASPSNPGNDACNLYVQGIGNQETSAGTTRAPSTLFVDSERNERRHKERKDQNSGANAPPRWPSTAPPSTQAFEGYEIISHELQFREHLSASKRQVLESAVSFINQLSQNPTVQSAPAQRHTREETINGIAIPSTEFLYWMIRDIESKKFGSYVFDYFRHVSLVSLKRMGLSLLRRGTSDDDFLLFSICVNSTAFKFINTTLSVDESHQMEEEMRESAERYRASAQSASEQLHLLTQSSVALLQALICSAFVNQRSGNMKLCWILAARACQVSMDLGLHSKFAIDMPRPLLDEELEAYYCFVWCYILDKNFAMSMRRPSCMFNVDPGIVTNQFTRINQPMSTLLLSYFELAKCQDLYVSYLRPRRLGDGNSLSHGQAINNLLTRMENIKNYIEDLRQPSPHWVGLYRDSELHALEFAYHSVMTAALRSVDFSSLDTRHIGEDYLQSSRQSLLSLHAMQQSSSSLGNKTTSIAFVNWTLLYYPLTAFFALFCNVVMTSHLNDFALMKRITDTLAENSELSPSVSELQILLTTFVSLVEHLVCRLDINTGIGNLSSFDGLGIINFNNREICQNETNNQNDGVVTATTGSSVPYSTSAQVDIGGGGYLLGTFDDLFMNLDESLLWGESHLQPSLDWPEEDILPS